MINIKNITLPESPTDGHLKSFIVLNENISEPSMKRRRLLQALAKNLVKSICSQDSKCMWTVWCSRPTTGPHQWKKYLWEGVMVVTGERTTRLKKDASLADLSFIKCIQPCELCELCTGKANELEMSDDKYFWEM